MFASGWLLEPMGKNETKMTLCAEVNPKLSSLIPNSLIKGANEDQAKQILKLNEVIGDYVKENRLDF